MCKGGGSPTKNNFQTFFMSACRNFSSFSSNLPELGQKKYAFYMPAQKKNREVKMATKTNLDGNVHTFNDCFLICFVYQVYGNEKW